MTLTIIGTVHTAFHEPAGTPIQPAYAQDAPGTAVILPEFAEGLCDLEGFDRIWLVYGFHRAPPAKLRVTPFRDTVARGVFATRAPCRPTPLGLSAVRLVAIEGTILKLAGVDLLDDTPLYDLKPYVPAFDAFPNSRAGWLDDTAENRTCADSRFAPPRP